MKMSFGLFLNFFFFGSEITSEPLSLIRHYQVYMSGFTQNQSKRKSLIKKLSSYGTIKKKTNKKYPPNTCHPDGKPKGSYPYVKCNYIILHSFICKSREISTKYHKCLTYKGAEHNSSCYHYLVRR